MPAKRTSRVYARDRNGTRRYYGDFRDYRDVGGRQEALIPPGAHRATTDRDLALELASRRLKELEERRRTRALLGIERQSGLASYAGHHLRQKARSGRVTSRTLENIERHLRTAVDFFGVGRELNAIGVRDVTAWMNELSITRNGRGGTLSPKTVRQYMDSLSNMYRRAQSESYVPPGFNPVLAILDKPPVESRREAKWLEVHDAALYLELSRSHQSPIDKHPVSFAFEVVATFLLTGGRANEVFGMEIRDVSFERQTVTFRPNSWRRLKTAGSHRTVPLWPQLGEILRPYLFGATQSGEGLLFPSPRTDEPIREFRRQLDGIAVRAGWSRGEIRSKMFRHTYCAARLQTLDGGAPVSEYTVMKELGHTSPAMVRRIYGHLGRIRHRSEVVEYRVEQHHDQLGDRIQLIA